MHPELDGRSLDIVHSLTASVFVYGTSLVILLKYHGADVQRRNNKFERTIFVNHPLAVLRLGQGFQC